jgi:hypothetical protein
MLRASVAIESRDPTKASPPAKGVVVLSLRGTLTVGTLTKALRDVEPGLRVGSPIGVVVDALQMTGYEAAAREQFVSWHHQRRECISRVAVVTENRLWHMVVRAMSFAARVPMQPFRELGPAMAWARDGA